MYVASLNIDLLFKKVFSNPEIARSFLQDFLGVVITELVILGIEHKLSDVFTTLPERAKDFISDDTLWSQPLETILAARTETLNILNNTTKGLDFLQKNRLIYIFQDNIVKNMRNKPYGKWFELAKKSKNHNNVKSDFDEFKNIPVMAEVLRRIEKTNLEPYEFKYVSDLYQYENMVEESQQEATRSQQEAIRQTERADRAEKAIRAERDRAEKAEKEKQESHLKVVHGFLMLGKDIPYIADFLGLSVEEIDRLVQQINEQ